MSIVRPHRLTPRVLAELVGTDKARLLMERWGGHKLPNLSPAMREREIRRLRILDEVDANRPYRAIAADLGISAATVSRSAKEAS